MNIISRTDFSIPAREEANVAAALTGRLQGTLSLVYVMEASRYELPSKGLIESLCRSRQTKLKKEAERLRREGAQVCLLHGHSISRGWNMIYNRAEGQQVARTGPTSHSYRFKS